MGETEATRKGPTMKTSLAPRILVGVLLSALVLVAYLTCGFTWAPLAEDGPLFDCHSMGNQICGPVTP